MYKFVFPKRHCPLPVASDCVARKEGGLLAISFQRCGFPFLNAQSYFFCLYTRTRNLVALLLNSSF